MSMQIVCAAIQSRNLIRFNYTGDAVSGLRIVEPHMIAYTRADNLALSAWFVSGASESQVVGWKTYLLEYMDAISVLPQQFAGPRPGYVPGGGKSFHNVQCEI